MRLRHSYANATWHSAHDTSGKGKSGVCHQTGWNVPEPNALQPEGCTLCLMMGGGKGCAGEASSLLLVVLMQVQEVAN